jgi:hypothetical protein
MRELDAGARALRTDEARDPLERLEMPFAPDSEILRRNAALGRDRGGLREHQRCAADRPSGKMREMPIVGVAVYRRILAHWRNADAVGEVNVAHAKFAKQMRHGSIVSIENDGGISCWFGAHGFASAAAMAGPPMDHILRRLAVK